MKFKKGDKVYDAQFGWGEVVDVLIEDTIHYPVLVDFSSTQESFKLDGRFYNKSQPTLSFTEYTLQGFSQQRPLPFKVGDVVYLSDNKKNWRTCNLGSINIYCDYWFATKAGNHYKYLALENPLKNPDTKIYTKEDL